MALFRKPLPPPPPPPPLEPPPPPEPPPARRFTDTSPTSVTILAPGLQVVGEIDSEDPVTVAGRFEGQITTTALFQIAESGAVLGQVRASAAALGGELTGTLEVQGKVEIRSTARVRATIHSSGIAMAEGSFFDGQVHMAEGGSSQAFQERRRNS